MMQSNIPQGNDLPFPETAYAVEIVPDICTDGTVVYFARHPEIPGCETHGGTVEEARQNLAEVWQLTEKGRKAPSFKQGMKALSPAGDTVPVA